MVQHEPPDQPQDKQKDKQSATTTRKSSGVRSSAGKTKREQSDASASTKARSKASRRQPPASSSTEAQPAYGQQKKRKNTTSVVPSSNIPTQPASPGSVAIPGAMAPPTSTTLVSAQPELLAENASTINYELTGNETLLAEANFAPDDANREPSLLEAADAITYINEAVETSGETANAEIIQDDEGIDAVTAQAQSLPIEEPIEDDATTLADIVKSAEAEELPAQTPRERYRFTHNNALGLLIERAFDDPGSPCRSYSDLERRARISREALSRYVTPRPDRRRSPTIDTLLAIADALHLSLESVCRSAAASARGLAVAPDDLLSDREETLRNSIATLSDEQFHAVVELLLQMRPQPPTSERG